jgi:branched-chain amino acid transport system ATP-binding protein
MIAPLLRVQGLSAGYGPLRVLHDIDFAITAGERLAIVGLNGHGKTTLFRSIMQLVGWQRGSVVFDGREIGGTRSLGEGRHTPNIVRLGIAMTPQGDAIFPGLTVREHLDCGAHARSAWRERAHRRREVYRLFPQLDELQDALVGKLSGGERRMVSIGRALMSDAKLYLVDEPTLGLAPKVSQRVIESLVNIPLQGKAMVIAEQNVAVLTGVVSRMIGMHAGRLRGEVGHVGLS